MTYQRTQMELTFATAEGSFHPPSSILDPRLKRNAAWWFDRMRRIVDLAFDWRPAPPSRPEQIWFTDLPANTRRQGQQSASSSASSPASRHDQEARNFAASVPQAIFSPQNQKIRSATSISRSTLARNHFRYSSLEMTPSPVKPS